MRIGTRAARTITAAAVALAIAAGAKPAGADDPPSAADKAMAEVLFRDGRALFEQGKYDEACPKLAESHRLEPKPGTILNVALCHEQQGKTATAWAEFMEAASLAARAKQSAREKAARERIALIEARLSKIKIDVTDAAPGILVKLDDRTLAPAVWTSAIPLDPGEHIVTASAPGRTTWVGKVTLGPGPSTETVSIPPLTGENASAPVHSNPIPSETAAPNAANTAAPPISTTTLSAAPNATPSAGPSAAPSAAKAASAAPPIETPWDPPRPTGMIVGIAVGGVGVAGIIVGSIFGARTFSKKHAGDAECNGYYCSQAGLDLQRDAEASATISTISFAVGIAGAFAGALLVVLNRPSAPAKAAASRIWIAPGGLPGPSLSAGGSF